MTDPTSDRHAAPSRSAPDDAPSAARGEGPPDVIQFAALDAEADAALARRHRVLRWTDAPFPPTEGASPDTLAALAGVRVAVTSVRRGFTREMLAALPALEAVCSWGVGYETLDMAALRERGIVVSNTPDVLDDCVADLAWALLLATARRVAVGDRYVKGGQWREIGQFPLSTRVSRKRMGILGLGRIGSAIARRGAGFGMDVRYTGRRPHADQPWTFEPDLQALAGWCDFLMIACAGGPETRHLVSAPVLRALGPQGILVNIARGSVVDQTALVNALSTGQLGGAGLDVLDGEPAVPPALRSMDQVVLMPHVGSATVETRAEMAQLVVANAQRYLQSGVLVSPLT
jgi:lactate dehydrogenase-like 2-hydroxyacid dehydrogenase